MTAAADSWQGPKSHHASTARANVVAKDASTVKAKIERHKDGTKDPTRHFCNRRGSDEQTLTEQRIHHGRTSSSTPTSHRRRC